VLREAEGKGPAEPARGPHHDGHLSGQVEES